MTKEVLKLALEALETAHINVLDDMLADEIQQAVTAIQEALAQPAQTSAERTLQALGYINNGGEFWKPPLGEVRKAQPEQEPVSDALIRQYITALMANKLVESANATKAMVDYVYSTPPARPPQRKPLTDEQILHKKDTYVAEPSIKYPLIDADWLNFARAIYKPPTA
jgi:hypothetical protein